MSKQMNNVVKNIVKCAAVAALGLAVTIPAMGGDLRIGINIGVPVPPPVVVVREEPVVVTYDTYVVGYRRNLYDADLRLRLARADEFTAYDELQSARRHEGEVAAALDDVEAVIADLHRRLGDRAGDAAAIHADVLATADRCAELRKIVAALDHKIASAHEDYEAARTLNDGRGMDEAQHRVRDNEGLQAAKAGELRDAEGRLAHLREMEAASAAFAADRARLADAEARHGGIMHDVEVAHDAVYNTEHRWADAHERVIVAMHDRDEALWILHRDDILAGRIDVATCGFNIDLGVWGGRLPRDPEVIHAYCVRDVAYIRANPVFIEARWGDTGRCGELVKIREFEHTREPERIKVVERVEVMKVEDRHRYYSEVVVNEHKRYDAEVVERRTAVAEHRAPHVTNFIEHKQVERANATAAVANHNAAVAEKDAHRESEKNAAQQKQLEAQSREIRRQRGEINEIKEQQNKEEATDSRASRVQRRAAEAQPAPAAEDSRSSRARRREEAEPAPAAPAGDDRAARARRRAEEAQPAQGAKTAGGAKDNGRTQGKDPQANDR